MQGCRKVSGILLTTLSVADKQRLKEAKQAIPDLNRTDSPK
jgi:hypothetical protein